MQLLDHLTHSQGTAARLFENRRCASPQGIILGLVHACGGVDGLLRDKTRPSRKPPLERALAGSASGTEKNKTSWLQGWEGKLAGKRRANVHND